MQWRRVIRDLGQAQRGNRREGARIRLPRGQQRDNGVGCVCLSPGAVDTELLRRAVSFGCVTLVGEHTDEWLASLRDAMTEVDKVRAEGPDL